MSQAINPKFSVSCENAAFQSDRIKQFIHFSCWILWSSGYKCGIITKFKVTGFSPDNRKMLANSSPVVSCRHREANTETVRHNHWTFIHSDLKTPNCTHLLIQTFYSRCFVWDFINKSAILPHNYEDGKRTLTSRIRHQSRISSTKLIGTENKYSSSMI